MESHAIAICSYEAVSLYVRHPTEGVSVGQLEENTMKTWTKPAVREQEVGLEVTSYLPAEIDVI